MADTTADDGKTYNVTYYNLDMIISLGYRIKSVIATRFRQWATKRLKEYMIKRFTIDDERLKGNGGGNYWKELLDRIRDIRYSEKVLYRQILDLYSTSVDYNPHSEESVRFFKIVQNKLHYAAHGHTAAEVIYQRADKRWRTAKTGRRRNKAYDSDRSDSILPALWQADEYDSQIGSDICGR